MNQIEAGAGSCEGWWTLYKAKAGDRENKQLVAGPFKNLITNQGLDFMGPGSGWIQYCQVGSGNSTPAFSDTALQTYVAGVSAKTSTDFSTAGIVTSPDYYAYVTIYYEFGVGAAAGNLSEIGTGWAVSGTTLYSRALIVDGGGSPTTITILADEILIAYYQWRVYPPTSDVTGTINISGTDYDYVLRASLVASSMGPYGLGWGLGAHFGSVITGRPGSSWGSQFNAFSGAIGTITDGPAGTLIGNAGVSNAAYTPGTLTRNMTNTYGITATSSIRSVQYCWGWGTYQIEFDPVIPKTNINVLSLVFTHSWARRTI